MDPPLKHIKMRKYNRYHYGPLESSIFDLETGENHLEGDWQYRKILDSGVEISAFTGERPLTVKQQIELDMEKAKQNAWSALSATDWYFVRKIETGKEVPEEIKNQRQSIKNSLEECLSSLQEELKNEL